MNLKLAPSPAPIPSALRGVPLHARPSAAAGCSILLVPDADGSVSLDWRRRLRRAELLRLAEDRGADLHAWARSIVAASIVAPRPVVLVAQGYGCLAAVLAGALRPGAIAGAMLLDPADPARYAAEALMEHTVPAFASTLVMDPEREDLSTSRAWYWALTWGSQMASFGRPAAQRDGGLALLEQLCRRVLE